MRFYNDCYKHIHSETFHMTSHSQVIAVSRNSDKAVLLQDWWSSVLFTEFYHFMSLESSTVLCYLNRWNPLELTTLLVKMALQRHRCLDICTVQPCMVTGLCPKNLHYTKCLCICDILYVKCFKRQWRLFWEARICLFMDYLMNIYFLHPFSQVRPSTSSNPLGLNVCEVANLIKIWNIPVSASIHIVIFLIYSLRNPWMAPLLT